MLKFIAFRGISNFSKLIKFTTRSTMSHVAFEDTDGTLIETWNFRGGTKTWWDISYLGKHTPGTEYQVWGLHLPDEQESFCRDFYWNLANVKYPYNWPGIVAYGLRLQHKERMGYFCSEGLVAPIGMVRGWKKIRPEHVSPGGFCYLLEAMGGGVIREGTV